MKICLYFTQINKRCAHINKSCPWIILKHDNSHKIVHFHYYLICCILYNAICVELCIHIINQTRQIIASYNELSPKLYTTKRTIYSNVIYIFLCYLLQVCQFALPQGSDENSRLQWSQYSVYQNFLAVTVYQNSSITITLPSLLWQPFITIQRNVPPTSLQAIKVWWPKECSI